MLSKLKIVSSILFLAAASSQAYSIEKAKTLVASGPLLQTLQIANVLVNDKITNPGVTETAVQIYFYNVDKKNPCWKQRFDYRNDANIHVASGLGCQTKIDRMTIEPLPVLGKTPAYSPYTFNIDTTKFVTQILIEQSVPPVFNPQTGGVEIAGTINVKIQQ
jgi:hypothetical protein